MFYREVSPQRTDQEVDAILAKWAKKEDVLFDQLEARYGRRPNFQLDNTNTSTAGGPTTGSQGAAAGAAGGNVGGNAGSNQPASSSSAAGAGAAGAGLAGSNQAGANTPKFILKKFEINDVFMCVNRPTGRLARVSRFACWSRVGMRGTGGGGGDGGGSGGHRWW